MMRAVTTEDLAILLRDANAVMDAEMSLSEARDALDRIDLRKYRGNPYFRAEVQRLRRELGHLFGDLIDLRLNPTGE